MRSFLGKHQGYEETTDKYGGPGVEGTDPQRSESYQRESKELPRKGPVKSLTFGLALLGLVS